MNTCVSMNCPFIGYCNHYNCIIDRGERCIYQDWFIRASMRILNERMKGTKNGVSEVQSKNEV